MILEVHAHQLYPVPDRTIHTDFNGVRRAKMSDEEYEQKDLKDFATYYSTIATTINHIRCLTDEDWAFDLEVRTDGRLRPPEQEVALLVRMVALLHGKEPSAVEVNVDGPMRATARVSFKYVANEELHPVSLKVMREKLDRDHNLEGSFEGITGAEYDLEAELAKQLAAMGVPGYEAYEEPIEFIPRKD